MPAQPAVVVLHDGRLPPATAMEPVTAHAAPRPTEQAGLAEALRGADVLFVYDFLSTAVPAAWHAADSVQWIHVAAAGVDTVMSAEVRASDVVDPEPLPPGHALWGLPNVLLTPHGSGDVHGWRTALTELFVDNLQRWGQGRPLRNVVDKSLGYVPSTGSRP